MTKQDFIRNMQNALKLVRIEYGLTQESMATALGVSKKTIIELEKNRIPLGWSQAVTLASVFGDSTVLQHSMGGELSDLIIAIAFQDMDVDYPKTLGGKIWWNTVEEKEDYRIQQNLFSRHYRLLDQNDRRLFTSFSFEEIEKVLLSLEKEQDSDR